MTNEKERHNQEEELQEITAQSDTQISADLPSGESAKDLDTTEDARGEKVAGDNFVISEGESSVDCQCIDNQKMYSEEDMQKLVEEAYLRGKNEAVKAQIEKDTAMRADASSRRQGGLERYFIGRASVWR